MIRYNKNPVHCITALRRHLPCRARSAVKEVFITPDPAQHGRRRGIAAFKEPAIV